jgi:hypothetical protein
VYKENKKVRVKVRQREKIKGKVDELIIYKRKGRDREIKKRDDKSVQRKQEGYGKSLAKGKN